MKKMPDAKEIFNRELLANSPDKQSLGKSAIILTV